MDKPIIETKPTVDEVIVVEGRDDTDAVLKAVNCITIETHGFGITRETWERIEKAYETKGIIIFTDPDRAGENIRRKIKEKFPDAKEAFLSRNQAGKDGDIGIENAKPEDIAAALLNAKSNVGEGGCKPGEACKGHGGKDGHNHGNDKPGEAFTLLDMEDWGLVGQEDSATRRTKMGEILGVGYGNGKTFLKRLNGFGIKREEIEEALKKL